MTLTTLIQIIFIGFITHNDQTFMIVTKLMFLDLLRQSDTLRKRISRTSKTHRNFMEKICLSFLDRCRVTLRAVS